MPEAKDAPREVDVTIDDKRQQSNFTKADWVKLMLGGGFAVVVGGACLHFLLGEGKSSAEFQRTTVQQNTAALTGVQAAIVSDTAADLVVAEALDDFTAEIDDLGDVARQQAKALEAYLDQAPPPETPQ